jgi:hypothetical protein
MIPNPQRRRRGAAVCPAGMLVVGLIVVMAMVWHNSAGFIHMRFEGTLVIAGIYATMRFFGGSNEILINQFQHTRKATSFDDSTEEMIKEP